jgi:lambda family phage portal protein
VNFLDKAIAFFSPQRGLARARARDVIQRIYEGADSGRRGSSWRSRRTSANAEIMQALVPMRDRARELVRNTPHAPRLIDVLTASIVGDGIRPVPNTGSDRLNDRVEQLWNDWQCQVDVQGVHSFYSMQVLAIRSMIESGEVVLRFIDRNPKDVDAEIPLQLQILESDFIDSYCDGIYGMESGENIRSRLGVGLGDYDRRLGLWLFPVHPGEMVAWTALNIASYTSKFIGDDQLIHLFVQQRPGQVRGVTWFAPMLQTARDFADFMDAVTVKARVEACFSAFVTQSSDLENLFEPTTANTPLDDSYATATNPPTITTLEPNTMKLLKPGQDIKFAQPTATSQIEPVLMFDLMAMAASVGATYDQISGDLRHANYSSLRAGMRSACATVRKSRRISRRASTSNSPSSRSPRSAAVIVSATV